MKRSSPNSGTSRAMVARITMAEKSIGSWLWWFAGLYAAIGDKNAALDWIEKLLLRTLPHCHSRPGGYEVQYAAIRSSQ